MAAQTLGHMLEEAHLAGWLSLGEPIANGSVVRKRTIKHRSLRGYYKTNENDPVSLGCVSTLGNSRKSRPARATGLRLGVASSAIRISIDSSLTGSTLSAAIKARMSGSDNALLCETETWAAVGTDASGSGKILYRGPISPTLFCAAMRARSRAARIRATPMSPRRSRR